MAALLTTVGIMGSIALFEGLAALLEHIEGDPEADVALALKQLASKNQRRAFGIQAVEQLGQEQVESNFARFNEIPSRVLTQAALDRSPQPAIGRDTGILDMVSQRLGVSPAQLGQASHPSRMGDMSQVARSIGTSPGIR